MRIIAQYLGVALPYLTVGYIIFMVLVFIYFYKAILKRYEEAQIISLEVQEKLNEIKDIDSVSDKLFIFNEWLNKRPNSSTYFNQVKQSWGKYYQKYMKMQQSGITYTPDVYDYFLEDIFVQKYGNRKYAEVIPGIFLAMGIFWTFLSIAVSVGGLNVNGDATALKTGIGILLTGMTFKFISSILGISFSVAWHYKDKNKYYLILVDSFNNLLDRLDEAFPTQEDGAILIEMQSIQKQQMEDFQSYLTDIMIPNMVSGFSSAMNQTLMPHLEQTQTLMKDMVTKASSTQIEGINQMVDHFVQSLSQITGDHMKDLGEALRVTTEWQQKVHGEMSSLVQSMQDSAKEQSLMVEKTTTLTEQIHSFTEQIVDYQGSLEKTVSRLNENTEKNSQLHEATSGLLERMTEERKLFNEYFEEHLRKLQTNIDSVISQTGLQANLLDKFEKNIINVQELTEAQESLSSGLKEQVSQYHQYNKSLTSLLEQFGQQGSTIGNLQEGLNKVQGSTSELLEKMTEERQVFNEYFHDHLQRLQTNIDSVISQTGSQADLLDRFDKQIQNVQVLTESQQSLSSGLTQQVTQYHAYNEDLSGILRQLVEQGSTFGQLQNSVNETLQVILDERKQMDQLTNDVLRQLDVQISAMDERSESLKTLWLSTKDTMVQANQKLSVSINNFMDGMHRGLQNTFDQFDQELSKSVQHLSKAVDAIQDGVIELPDALQTLKQSVDELNKHAKKMVNVQVQQ